MLARTYAGADHVMQVQTAAGRFVCVNLREYLQQTDGRHGSYGLVARLLRCGGVQVGVGGSTCSGDSSTCLYNLT